MARGEHAIIRVLMLLALLACSAAFAAEERLDDLAQDGRGNVWAGSRARHGELARRSGEQWEWIAVPELNGAAPVRFLPLRDGSMACFWLLQRGNGSALSRHRDREPPVITHFSEKLKEPRLFERSDGSIVVTEQGPAVIQARWGEAATATILAEELFRPPLRESDSAERVYAPTRAIEVEPQRLLLWSYGLAPSDYQWRLASFVEVTADGEFKRLEIPGMEAGARLTDALGVGENKLWVGKAGVGLFSVELATGQASPVRVPNQTEFTFIEQIFRDGEDIAVITCPRPTEYGSAPEQARISGRVSLIITTFYDMLRRAGRLHRFRDSKWRTFSIGLDVTPRFADWDRPRLRIPGALILGASGSGPWIFPDKEDQPPVLLDWRQDFPLQGADRFAVTAPGELLALHNGATAKASLKAKRGGSKLRIAEVKTWAQLLRDERGALWGFPGAFAAWSGDEWTVNELPPNLQRGAGFKWLPDEHNRGWLLTAEGAVGICDFSTGGWTSFPSLRDALQAQQPRGVTVQDAGNPFLNPIFDGTGRIAFFQLPNSIHYFAEGKWVSFNLQEIAGSDATLNGSPRFEDQQLCVPVSGRIYRWSDATQEWMSFEPGEDEPISTQAQKQEVEIPPDCPIQNPASAAMDSFGIVWLISPERVLHKAIPGHTVRAIQEDEPNPFRYGAAVKKVHIDARGGAFLDTTEYGFTHHHFLIRADGVLPETHATLKRVSGDTAVVEMRSPAEESGAKRWFQIKLNDAPWELVGKNGELLLERLRVGKHRLQVRALDERLNGDPTPAVLEWEITTDPEKEPRELIAQLASPEEVLRRNAAKALRQLGAAALPALRPARESATAEQLWWIDAVIRQIEQDRGQQPE